jgi:GNAT superfamily N-acetyltransferase
VKNSNIPEDQAEILEDDMGAVIGLCKQEKLPFIVAIKGNAPSFTPQSRYAPSAKPAMPQFEVVVGFGFGQTYSYGLGLSGIREGRSRATAELQFYVHPEYTRKGVGRSLLDRLIQVMSPSYA